MDANNWTALCIFAYILGYLTCYLFKECDPIRNAPLHKPPGIIPSPGEKWELKPAPGDPFPQTKHYLVTILETRENWVRYQVGETFSDERRLVTDFIRLYQKTDLDS